MVEVLVGIIASGKSTYSSERARSGAIIVNDDAIVEAVHGGDYTLYDKKLKPLYKNIENNILSSAILLGRDCIIDRGTNVSRKSRLRWIGVAQSMETPIRAVVFYDDGAAVNADRRMQHNSRGLSLDFWYGAARHQLSSWQQPTLEEGFVDIIHR